MGTISKTSNTWSTGRLVTAVLGAVVIVFALHQMIRAQTQQPQESSEAMLTYSRGQAVWPVYEGWHPNADGTIDLWFGYLNQNYQEQPDIPIGPDNNISNPLNSNVDAGQPTH